MELGGIDKLHESFLTERRKRGYVLRNDSSGPDDNSVRDRSCENRVDSLSFKGVTNGAIALFRFQVVPSR